MKVHKKDGKNYVDKNEKKSNKNDIVATESGKNQVVGKQKRRKTKVQKLIKSIRYISTHIDKKLCVFSGIHETEEQLLKLKYRVSRPGLYNNLRGRVNSHVGLKFSWIHVTKANKKRWDAEVRNTEKHLSSKAKKWKVHTNS